MKRLLRPGACMIGLSPKPMSLIVDIDFGMKECQVWTMLQKTKYEMFRCCSNFSKIHITQFNPISSVEYKFHRNLISVRLFEVKHLVCCRGPAGDMSNWLSYQGSGRLGTGDGHTNEIAHVSWRLQVLRCFWIHPGKNKLAGGRWVDHNLKIYLNH